MTRWPRRPPAARPRSPASADAETAYTAGLALLARRELSEAQVRQRLARKGFPPDGIDIAVARLKEERALDDARVAEAIARTEAGLRGRGRLRADRRIQAAGIASTTARRALEQTYAELDPDALVDAALAKRLRRREGPLDQREHARLYRFLVGQGFEPERAAAALRRVSKAGDQGDDA